MFNKYDFTNFWDGNSTYTSPPPSDELIASIEQELGYKLPLSYIWLMKQHNGGFPINNCFPINHLVSGSFDCDVIMIDGVYGIGREKDHSLCGSMGSKFWIDEWGYPPIGVAICDCPSGGHDMIFLDYRECGPDGEPKVVHVDQEDNYEITVLADDFESFIRGLVSEESIE